MIKWLWEIVLEEWSDDNRRKLLTFSTGSDRAPVNGLKSLKFYIIKDGQDDKAENAETEKNEKTETKENTHTNEKKDKNEKTEQKGETEPH